MFSEIFNLLISATFYFFILILFLRLLFQLVRADFHNPLSQFIVKVTNPVLVPVRRIVPPMGHLDSASLLLIVVIKIIELCLKQLIVYGGISSFYNIFAVSIIELVHMGLNFYLFAIIGQIILSWVAPYNDNPAVGILYQITEPVMRPARKLIPPMGGLDVSPIIILLSIQVLELLLLHPSGLLPNFFAILGRALGLL